MPTLHRKLEKRRKLRVSVSFPGSKCLFVVFLSLKICSCVHVVSDWDRNWAPAGNWAQASVSQLATVTDVWLLGLLWLCQKLGQSLFCIEGPERLAFFFKTFFFSFLFFLSWQKWSS